MARALRLRTLRSAALRGLAWTLPGVALAWTVPVVVEGIVGPTVGRTIATANAVALGGLAAGFAFAAAQVVAGLIEVHAQRPIARDRHAARAALGAGLVSAQGVVLVFVQVEAVPSLVGSGLAHAIRQAERVEWLIALPTALVVGQVFGAATYIRLSATTDVHDLVLLSAALAVLASLISTPFVPSLVFAPAVGVWSFGVCMFCSLAGRRLAELHAWLDQLERRWLPPLPDEGVD